MRFLLRVVLLIHLADVIFQSGVTVWAANFTTDDHRLSSLLNLRNNKTHQQPAAANKLYVDATASTLVSELKACGWGATSIITSDDINVTTVNFVLDLVNSDTIPLVHEEIGRRNSDPKKLEEKIWREYHQQRIVNFIWLTSQPHEVVNIVNNVFEREGRSYGALMSNRIRFILIAVAESASGVENKLRSSVFDNVALLGVTENPPSLDSAYTLMWRQNRQREFEAIVGLDLHNMKGQSTSCKMFPNLQYGLNGRQLIGLAKQWIPDLHVVKDGKTGELRYAGFYVDVFDDIATSLNFTYVLQPEPGKDDELTWTDYQEIVAAGEVDFGVALYLSNGMFNYSTTTTYPIMYGDVVGVYVNTQGPLNYQLFQILRFEVLICLGGSLIFTMIFYLGLMRLLTRQKTGASISKSASKAKSLKRGKQNSNLFRSKGGVLAWHWDYRRTEHQRRFSFNMELKTVSLRCHNQDISVRHDDSLNIDRNTSSLPTESNHPQVTHFKRSNNTDKLRHEDEEGIGGFPRRRSSIDTNANNYDGSQFYIGNSINRDIESLDGTQERTNNGLSVGDSHSEFCDTYCLGPKSILEQHLEILFQFIGSIFNQGTLPSPKYMSPRLLISAWCLMMLVINATFTGNLTAAFIDDDDNIPFTTFHDLLQRGDFRWGVEKDSTASKLMSLAEKDSTLHRLYDGIEKFSKTDPSVHSPLDSLISNLKSGKFVALISSLLLQYVKEHTTAKLVIMKEKLLPANSGYIFPKSSELTDLISEQIIAMTDVGVIDRLYRKHKGNFSDVLRDAENTKTRSLDLGSVAVVFYYCGYGAVTALGVLVAEWLFFKIRSLRCTRS